MSYYTEQEATRITKEVEKMKPLIDKYVKVSLNKTIEKFGLESGWVGNYNMKRCESNLDLEPIEIYAENDEIFEYFWNSIPDDTQKLMTYFDYEITSGD